MSIIYVVGIMWTNINIRNGNLQWKTWVKENFYLYVSFVLQILFLVQKQNMIRPVNTIASLRWILNARSFQIAINLESICSSIWIICSLCKMWNRIDPVVIQLCRQFSLFFTKQKKISTQANIFSQEIHLPQLYLCFHLV